MNMVDLHVHSNRSDGSFTPSELVDYAQKKGLKAFALTDHDTTEGLDEAIAAAKGKDIEVIPGIEFSTEYEGKDVHIVGLYIDYQHDSFQKYLADFQESRRIRNEKMCQKLNEHGIDISYEHLKECFPDAVITRAHYAKYLLQHGYVKSMPEAFDRFIGDRAPCFIPREKVTPEQAVKLILKSGGIPVLAHPTLYHMSTERLEQLIVTLKAAGLMAMEGIYSTYTSGEARQMQALCKKYNLLVSGGSDFHGNTKPGLDLATGYGSLAIPYDVLAAMKARLAFRGEIVFSDMDGTLLRDDKTISPALLTEINAFLSRGGKLVLSSGRPLDSILEVAKQFDLVMPGMYIIAFNGALIYDCDKEKAIFESKIPRKTLARLNELILENHIHCHAYETGENFAQTIVCEQDDEELAFYRINVHLPYRIVGCLAKDIQNEPYKVLAVQLGEDHTNLEHFNRRLNYELGDSMHTFYSTPHYLECLMKDASKGNAVKFMCDYLGIPVSCSIACGDAGNDTPMLKAAGLGVCMCNGTLDTKLAGDIVTVDSNEEDGLLEIFRRYTI